MTDRTGPRKPYAAFLLSRAPGIGVAADCATPAGLWLGEACAPLQFVGSLLAGSLSGLKGLVWTAPDKSTRQVLLEGFEESA